MNKYFLFCLLLISYVCFGANSENSNIQTVSKAQAKFNLNNLYSNNKYGAMDYGVYNPESAIKYCRSEIPDGGISPESTITAPIPTDADCGKLSSRGPGAQMAYGCNVDLTQPDSIGARLAHSIVKINIPGSGICSGTLIARDWVITAAHCVTDNTGEFLPQIKNQSVTIANSRQNTEIVDNIYITADFRYYITKKPTEQHPYPTYFNGDFALLHLKNPLPVDESNLITLSRESLPEGAPISVWSAGYGLTEKQAFGKLQFRQQYFITNTYDHNWLGGKTGNFGEIYITGSIPQEYNGEASAWKLTGQGDSGGPIIWQNANGKLYLEGVHSGGLFCNYPGYFAKMPYPLIRSLSIPYYYDLITSIMNGSVNELLIRQLRYSKRQKMLFVINNHNEIYSYKTSGSGSGLVEASKESTGLLPTQIATANYKNDLTNLYDRYVFVSNYFESTISSYSVDDSGNLNKLPDTRISYPYTKTPNLIDIKTFNKSVYVIDKNNMISSYLINSDGSLKLMHYIASADEPSSAGVVYRQRLSPGMNYSYIALFVANYNDKSISIYNITNFWNLELVKKGHLGDHMGHPIEISAVPEEPEYFYLLTTTGVFLLRFNYNLMVEQISDYRRTFNIYSHIKAISDKEFAVTANNTVQIFNILSDDSVSLKKSYNFNSAGGVDVGDKDILYVTNYFENAIYTFYTNYSVIYRPVQTGTNPTSVKYMEWKS